MLLTNDGIAQVICNMLTSIAVFFYLFLSRPFDNDLLNFTETCNEGAVLLFAYLIFGFTDLVVSPEDEVQIGWVALAILFANILFNLCIFTKALTRRSKLSYKRYKFQKELKLKILREQEERRLRQL